MQVLLEAGDHAVVVTPNYQAAETVPLSAVRGHRRRAATRERAGPSTSTRSRRRLRPNTRVVSVNFPNNPTGKVIDGDRLARAWPQLCDERGIHLFSDEVYRGLERDPARTLPQAADLSPSGAVAERDVQVLGLPGLRIGWIACRTGSLQPAGAGQALHHHLQLGAERGAGPDRPEGARARSSSATAGSSRPTCRPSRRSSPSSPTYSSGRRRTAVVSPTRATSGGRTAVEDVLRRAGRAGRRPAAAREHLPLRAHRHSRPTVSGSASAGSIPSRRWRSSRTGCERRS